MCDEIVAEDMEDLNRSEVRPDKRKIRGEPFIHYLGSSSILIARILPNSILKAGVSNGEALLNCNPQTSISLEFMANVPEVKVIEITIDRIVKLGVCCVWHSAQNIEVGKE
jgi:hypothetical protein